MKARAQSQKRKLPLKIIYLHFCLLLFAFCLLPSAVHVASAKNLSSSDTPANLAGEAAKRGEELRRKWNLDAAESAFREAAALDPTNLEAALGLARIARARFDYPAAIRLLDKAIERNQNSAAAFAEYGLIYLSAEEPARAQLYFERALRLDPSNESAIIGQAAVDLFNRNYSRAESRLRQYIARNTDSSVAHSVLARVLIEQNKNDEAAAEASRAIAINEYNADALYTLAVIRASERKPDEVRALARRAVSLDSYSAGARRLLSQYLDGRAGYEQKVSEEARRSYERGRALKRDGKLDEAVAEFEAALRIEPRYYRALIALGDVWLRSGDYERAAAAARFAIEVDPEGAIAHFELSSAHRGIWERARTLVGAPDFAASFYERAAPPAFQLTREVFPNYRMLTRDQQMVIDEAVAPLAAFLPKLARSKARHYLIAYDERASDVNDLSDAGEERTFDGRYYASIRGVGGRITVSGVEYIEMAARGGFNTIAHEFAHQVHMAAMSKDEQKAIHKLYERARSEGRVLDYYAAANEYEYFAQGYEAFISERKRPSAGVTARHTRNELIERDPELYKFIFKLASRSRAVAVGSKFNGRSTSENR